MKVKYVEERFGYWMEFGTYADGYVDLCSNGNDIATHISKDQCEYLSGIHNEMCELVAKLYTALCETGNQELADKIYYESITN